MKRGYLLRAEAKKAAANRRPVSQKLQTQTEPLAPSTPKSTSEPQPVQNLGGFDVDNKGRHLLGNARYGNLTEEDKALPSDYDLNKSQFRTVYKDFTESSKDAGDIVTIPQIVPNDETPCQWIVNGSTREKVHNSPGYPARIPKPCRPDLIQVTSTPEMGIGLFAKRNIKGGEVLLAERPLLVAPVVLKTSYQPQAVMTTTRRSKFSKSSCTNSKVASNGSGPLLGIMRSNAYGIGNLYDGSDRPDLGKYGAVCKIGSRINHSCLPNVNYYFKLNSFSVQFFALRDIKAGEQLFYSYCSGESTRAQRQVALALYGFICECAACANATPKADKLRNTFGPQTTLISKMVLEKPSRFNEAALQDAMRLAKDMVREGLDTRYEFVGLLASISVGCQKLGKLKESDQYRALMKAHRKCYKEDE